VEKSESREPVNDMTISEKGAVSAFKTAITGKFPSATFASVAVKRFSSNPRIIIATDRSIKADKNSIVKFKAVLIASIPKARFEPILIYTKKKQVIVCTRLSTHGGHIAVEIARKLAKHHGTKLVVLENNILCFMMLDAASNEIASVVTFFDASIETLHAVNEEFHAWINKVIA
jgi:hypothetical protein